MMLEQRGRHFDPVLLDAFMEVLGRTGPDARAQLRSRPGGARRAHARDLCYARSNAATPRGPRARSRTAIEDGIAPDDAARRGDRPGAAQLDVLSSRRDRPRTEHRAHDHAPRARHALPLHDGGTEPTASACCSRASGRRAHARLQMVHDQLAAAGFQTIFDTDLDASGCWSSSRAVARPRRRRRHRRGRDGRVALRELRSTHPECRSSSGPRRRQPAARARRHAVLERIDESVEAVEDCSRRRRRQASA